MEIKFWLNKEKKLVNPELFSKVADEWAKNINDEGGNQKNKQSQLRKFYDEVLLFYNRIQGDKEKFEQMLPYIKLLRAKVYYARGRDHITDKFKDFIESCIDQIHTWEDFVVFKNFFEAFMGFYRYYNKG
jgi:CRISPR-associated protein Csm2